MTSTYQNQYKIRIQHPEFEIQYSAFRISIENQYREFRIQFQFQYHEIQFIVLVPWVQYKNRWHNKYFDQQTNSKIRRVRTQYSKSSFRLNISKFNLSRWYLDSSTRTDDKASILVRKAIQNPEIQLSELEIFYYSTDIFDFNDQSFGFRLRHIDFSSRIVIMSTTQLYYDETANLDHFLHVLNHECYSLLTLSAWIEAVYCHLIDETLEWAKNDENVTRIYYNVYHNAVIDRDERKLYQLLENRFAISLRYRVDKTLKKIKQKRHEFIESYYIRVKTLYEHVEDRNKSIDQYLNYEHDFCLLKVVNWFVADLRNIKLRSQMLENFWIMQRQNRFIDISLQSICTTAQLKYTIMKSRIQQSSANEQSLIICQINSAIVSNINVESINKIFVSELWMSPLSSVDISIVVNESQSISEQISCKLSKISTAVTITDIESIVSEFTSSKRSSFEISTVYESQLILKKNTCSLSENCIVNITNTFEQSVASKFVDWFVSTNMQKSSFEISTVYESPSVLVQIRSETSKINATTVNSSDIESIDEIFASESFKWSASITTLSEAIVVYEFSFVLKKMSCDLSEISTDIVNSSDIESIDEILASESRNWTVAAAKKKIFDLAVIFHAISKNSFASYSENIEISIVVNMLSHEHLIHEDDFATETFDSDSELDVSAKNPLIQHIENLKTLKKNSIYIYELSALSAFDFSIDIDVEIYTIDIEAVIQSFVTSLRRKMQLSSFRDLALRNISFDWNRSSTSSIDRRTSSISTCITTSNVTFDFIEIAKTEDTANIEFYERKQLFCFTMYSSVLVSIEYITESNTNFYEKKQFCCFDKFFVSTFIDCVVSEHSDFYEKKQFCFSVDVDTVDIVCFAVVVVNIDALILIADMIKKKKYSWMNLILLLIWIWIEYLITTKHKRLSKMKIKRLSESEHIESRSQIVVEISIEFAYKIALFSDIRQRLESLR